MLGSTCCSSVAWAANVSRAQQLHRLVEQPAHAAQHLLAAGQPLLHLGGGLAQAEVDVPAHGAVDALAGLAVVAQAVVRQGQGEGPVLAGPPAAWPVR